MLLKVLSSCSTLTKNRYHKKRAYSSTQFQLSFFTEKLRLIQIEKVLSKSARTFN